MLVLTRKKSQLIQIGDNIVIKVIRTGPGTVKLGIEAPSHVRVMRGELDEKLTRLYECPDSPEPGEQEPRSESRGGRVSPVELATSECRRADLVEEEEPVSHLSRRKTRGCVA